MLITVKKMFFVCLFLLLVMTVVPSMAHAEILSLGGSRVEVVNGEISNADAKRVVKQFQARYERKDFNDRDLEKLIARYNGKYLPDAYFLLGKMKFMKSSYAESYEILTKFYDLYNDHKIVRSGALKKTLDNATRKLIKEVDAEKNRHFRHLDTLVKFAVLHRYITGSLPKEFKSYIEKPYERTETIGVIKRNKIKKTSDGWYEIGAMTKWKKGECKCCPKIIEDKYQQREFPGKKYKYTDGFKSYEDMLQAEFQLMQRVFYALFLEATLPEASYAIGNKLQKHKKRPEQLHRSSMYYVEPRYDSVQTYTLWMSSYDWNTMDKYSNAVDFGWNIDSNCQNDIEEKIDWFQNNSRRKLEFLNMPINFKIKYLENVKVWRKDKKLYVKFSGKTPVATVRYPSLKGLIKEKHGSLYDWVGLTRSKKSVKDGGLI